MTGRIGRPSLILGWAIVACVTVVAVTLVGLVIYVREANEQRKEDVIASCERGNAARDNLNAIVVHFDLTLPLLPILDCATIVH